MKSSTIRRSTLSRETMEVIETLAKEQEDNGLPGEYVRPDEIEIDNNNGVSQEIDLLWQNFKTNQFNTNSPMLNVCIGIVIGVLATLLVMFCLNAVSAKHSSKIEKAAPAGIENVDKNKTVETSIEEQTSITEEQNAGAMAPENESQTGENTTTLDTSKMTKYTIKSGDTIESIIKKHYGTYSPDKAEQIMQVNNMASLDRISIDQEILLP